MLEWIIRSVFVILGAAIIGMMGSGTGFSKIVLVLLLAYIASVIAIKIWEKRQLNS